MNYTEQTPSTNWAPLNYKNRTIAEVWFKPEGEQHVLTFRLPTQSFQLPDLSPFLTVENLLKSVSIPVSEVESWGFALTETGQPLEELSQPLKPPAEGDAYLPVFVRLKPPAVLADCTDFEQSGTLSSQWQHLMTRWNTILAAEVNIDTLRLRMEGVRAEMESAVNKSLSTDDKLNAFNADVAQWNKAKSRARYTLPKAKEFVHRATWALGTPERKKLDERFKYDAPPPLTQAEMDSLRNELDNLLKDRQILAAQGLTAYQECRNCASDMQGTLQTLQRNAATNAQKKRVATRAKK
ncbi:MAG TPA: hypothetical protein PLX97_07870 [Gemmatales bacterium]|nr:hypothetical protein [Gemmatales bacterium]